jgi:hypothetical protein
VLLHFLVGPGKGGAQLLGLFSRCQQQTRKIGKMHFDLEMGVDSLVLAKVGREVRLLQWQIYYESGHLKGPQGFLFHSKSS